MPTTDARSLSPDEVYALTAYSLNMDGLVDDDFVLTQSNFAKQRLPNENSFILDDRKDSDIMAKSRPCMRNCKPQATITKSANTLGVTPE